LLFTTLSLFFFGAAVLLNVLGHPTQEQKAAADDYNELLKEKDNNDAEQTMLKQSLATIEQEHMEVRQMNASILEYGCALEEMIMSKAHEGFALWKKVNLMHRTDNLRPILRSTLLKLVMAFG